MNDYYNNLFNQNNTIYNPFENIFSSDYSLLNQYNYRPNASDYQTFSNNTFANAFKTPNMNTSTNNIKDFFANFTNGNALGTLGAIGSVASAIGGILQAREVKKYNNKVLAMQEAQANRLIAREDANNKALNEGLNAFFDKNKNTKLT